MSLFSDIQIYGLLFIPPTFSEKYSRKLSESRSRGGALHTSRNVVSPAASANYDRPPPTIWNRPGTAFRKIIRHSASDRPSPLGGFRTIASRIPPRSEGHRHEMQRPENHPNEKRLTRPAQRIRRPRDTTAEKRPERKKRRKNPAQRIRQPRGTAAAKRPERKNTEKSRTADTTASGYGGSETTRTEKHGKIPHGGYGGLGVRRQGNDPNGKSDGKELIPTDSEVRKERQKRGRLG